MNQLKVKDKVTMLYSLIVSFFIRNLYIEIIEREEDFLNIGISSIKEIFFFQMKN